jgi:hypothetical protein
MLELEEQMLEMDEQIYKLSNQCFVRSNTKPMEMGSICSHGGAHCKYLVILSSVANGSVG